MTGGPSGSVDRPEGPGPLELLVAPIAHWRLLATLGFVTLIAASVFALLVPQRYSANASFVPDEDEMTSLPTGLLSLAGQFGLPMAGSGSTSPQFYSDLIRSRVIIRGLLDAVVPTDSGPARVLDLLRIQDPSQARRLEKAEIAMRRRIGVTFDRVTRRVDISVWMGHPETAKAVAESLLARVDAFDRTIRRSRAGNRRVFVERQLEAAGDSLRQAEGALEAFLERNRIVSGSPQLEAQRDRLGRAIALRQEIFLALARESEQARLQEVDNRPVITIIDEPIAPTRRTWPRRRGLVLLACLGTLVPVWVLLVLVEIGREQPAVAGDAAKALARLGAAARDVRHPLGRRPAG
jgi:uncharacterized protein involved in exopolysaccharide biosynthesis